MTPKRWYCCPGVGMILTVVLCCVLGVVYLCSNFPLLLQFSASRRGSLAGLCLHILRMTVLAEVIAAAATIALGAVNHGFFPRFAVGELWRGIPVFVWPVCAVLPVLLGLVWAGVLTRFGRTGGWVLYFLFIGGCFSTDKWLHLLAEQATVDGGVSRGRAGGTGRVRGKVVDESGGEIVTLLV